MKSERRHHRHSKKKRRRRKGVKKKRRRRKQLMLSEKAISIWQAAYNRRRIWRNSRSNMLFDANNNDGGGGEGGEPAARKETMPSMPGNMLICAFSNSLTAKQTCFLHERKHLEEEKEGIGRKLAEKLERHFQPPRKYPYLISWRQRLRLSVMYVTG